MLVINASQGVPNALPREAGLSGAQPLLESLKSIKRNGDLELVVRSRAGQYCLSPVQRGSALAPCRACHGCQAHSRWEWQERIQAEVNDAGYSLFCTLTLEGASPDLDYGRVTKWIKLLKRRYGVCDGDFRHAFFGEFGDLNGRAHFHGVLHIQRAKVTREQIEQAWSDPPQGLPTKPERWGCGGGFAKCPRVHPGVPQYVAKYVGKDTGRSGPDGRRLRPCVSRSYGFQGLYGEVDACKGDLFLLRRKLLIMQSPSYNRLPHGDRLPWFMVNRAIARLKAHMAACRPDVRTFEQIVADRLDQERHRASARAYDAKLASALPFDPERHFHTEKGVRMLRTHTEQTAKPEYNCACPTCVRLFGGRGLPQMASEGYQPSKPPEPMRPVAQITDVLTLIRMAAVMNDDEAALLRLRRKWQGPRLPRPEPSPLAGSSTLGKPSNPNLLRACAAAGYKVASSRPWRPELTAYEQIPTYFPARGRWVTIPVLVGLADEDGFTQWPVPPVSRGAGGSLPPGDPE